MESTEQNVANIDTNALSIQELKNELNQHADEVRKIVDKKQDKNNLQAEERKALRLEYTKLAHIARAISTRTLDDSETEKYRDLYKRFSDKAASFGSSIKSYFSEKTFDDIKGLENVKKVVKSFIFMLKNPDIVKYYKFEGGLGMLMYGAPGTGKTMFAEAIAHEMDLPLFLVTPADIFKPHVGESEESVKNLFEDIDAAPDGAILFIDECESIFSARKSDTQDYKAAVTTELLQRINGFGINGSKRIMIAATNKPDAIDPAYLRFKRFSHLVHVTPPDREAKLAIIKSKLKGIEVEEGVIDYVLENTEKKEIDPRTGKEVIKAYFSGADICGICEEACRLALEEIENSGSNKTIPLRKDMFDKAFAKNKGSISQEMLDYYSNFNKLESNKING